MSNIMLKARDEDKCTEELYNDNPTANSGSFTKVVENETQKRMTYKLDYVYEQGVETTLQDFLSSRSSEINTRKSDKNI